MYEWDAWLAPEKQEVLLLGVKTASHSILS